MGHMPGSYYRIPLGKDALRKIQRAREMQFKKLSKKR